LKLSQEETYIMAIGVLDPPPSYGIFNFQFDGHTFFSYTLRLHGLFFFRSKICVWMKWFRVHFYKIRHANNPILDNEFERRYRKSDAEKNKLTFPSELFGIGRLGKETSASLTTSLVSNGASSSSYSSACLCSLSGVGSLSDSSPEAVGETAILL